MRHHRAFTLIELLVVIAIIAILISIILPALGNAKEAARSLKCATQIRNMAIALELYADDHKELFPPRSQPRWVERLDPYYEVPQILLCPTDFEPVGGTDGNTEIDQRRRSYFINGFNDYHADADPNSNDVNASIGKSMPRGGIWQPSDTSIWGEKRTESTHFYLDLLEGLGNDFTELESARHVGEASNFGFADVSVRTIKGPRSLTPINLWGVTPWGRQPIPG